MTKLERLQQEEEALYREWEEKDRQYRERRAKLTKAILAALMEGTDDE